MFDNRLMKLREELGRTKKEVAEALGMPYTTYSNYESNLREPNSEVLIKIADFYNVSIDYLLGLTDIKSIDEDLKVTCKYTGLSEKAAMFIHHLNKKDVNNQYEAINLENMLNSLNILLSSDCIEKFLIDLFHYLFIDFEHDDKMALIAKIKSDTSEQENELIFTTKVLEWAALYELQECFQQLKTNMANYVIYDIEKAFIDEYNMVVTESEKENYNMWKKFQDYASENKDN